MTQEERDAWLCIGLVPGLGSVLTRRCVETFGSVTKLLDADPRALARIDGISARKAADIADAIYRINGSDQHKREIESAERLSVRLVQLGTPGFPRSLALISDPPPVLYVRGELAEQDMVAIAIVGSRRCSRYGLEQADRFAAQLSQSGLTIVSGGALGIDTAAHRATLRVSGRTIAVLGSGLARPYPSDNLELFEQIIRSGGALITELPLAAPPLRENFPSRNRIISGLSLGVVVIEAETRSGALITARLCAEDHGREAMALPGPVDSATSAGCHKILREGWATLVTKPTDVMDALGETGTILQAAVEQTPPEQPASDTPVSPSGLFRHASEILTMTDPLERGLTPSQCKIIRALDQPKLLDQISSITGLTVQVIQSDLTLLEIRGLVQRAGPQYCRRRKN